MAQPTRIDDLDDEEPDAPLPPAKRRKLTDKELEDFYDKTSARILQERSDFLLPQVVNLVATDKWVNLRPEYQRRLRWDDKKKSLLIESLLMNIPIPIRLESRFSRYLTIVRIDNSISICLQKISGPLCQAAPRLL